MTRFRHTPNGRHPETIRIGRRTFPVQERLAIRGRTYLLLETLNARPHKRHMVYDPQARDLRSLLVLPNSRAAEQHIHVLKRLAGGNDTLPKIWDWAVDRDRILIVLTWVRGPTLDDFLARVRTGKTTRPSAVEVFRLFRGLAHGIAHLNQNLMVAHGDLKPANLVLTRKPSRLVTIDFGSSWLVEQTTDRQQGDGVSATYAAPELQTGRTFVDFRADQFSASVILYEMLTLQLPYDNLGGKAGRPGYCDQIADKLIAPSRLSPDLAQVPNSIRVAINGIAMRGLALDPDARYESRSAWLQAIDDTFAQIRLRSPLSPINTRLTQFVSWLLDSLCLR